MGVLCHTQPVKTKLLVKELTTCLSQEHLNMQIMHFWGRQGCKKDTKWESETANTCQII